MFLGNKLIQRVVVIFTATLFLSFGIKQITPRLQKKIKTAVNSTFEIDTFQLNKIDVDTAINAITPIKLDGDNLFTIMHENSNVGYLYLGEAHSMKRMFDYIVLFNPDLTIKKSKVLIYREDYGKQIGSQRWLKQFIGMSMNDTPIYGENIDAISGATISASSMTKAIGNVLKSVQILKEKELIK